MVFSSNKADRHDTTAILLKVALNTTPYPLIVSKFISTSDINEKNLYKFTLVDGYIRLYEVRRFGEYRYNVINTWIKFRTVSSEILFINFLDDDFNDFVLRLLAVLKADVCINILINNIRCYGLKGKQNWFILRDNKKKQQKNNKKNPLSINKLAH